MVWLTVAALAGEACLPGRVLAGGACCWPGQNVVNGSCSGAPECPTGTTLAGETCAPARAVGVYDPRTGEGVTGLLFQGDADRLLGLGSPDPIRMTEPGRFSASGRSVAIGGDPLILGGLPVKDVVLKVEGVLPQLVTCAPEDGSVTIKFTVSASGVVASASVKTSTFPEPAVGDCARAAFSGLTFRAPEGGGIGIVVVPLVFGPD